MIVPTLGSDRPFNPLVLHAVSHTFEEMLACAQLIAFGVLERHPRLRVVFLESGGGWVPFWLERLDEQAETFGAFCPDLRLTPSEYFARQCWISYEIDEHTLPALAPFIGEGRIVWGSDYPHHDATFPGAVDTLRAHDGPAAHPTSRRRSWAPTPRSSTAFPRPRPPTGRAVTERCWATSYREAADRYGDTAALCHARRGRALLRAPSTELSDDVAAGLLGPGRAPRRRRGPGPPLGPRLRRRLRGGGQDRRRHRRGERPAVASRAPSLSRRGPAPSGGDLGAAGARDRPRRGGRGAGRGRGRPRRRSHVLLDELRASRTSHPSGTAAGHRPATVGPRPARGRGVHLGDHGRAQGSGVHLAPARGDRRRRRRRAVGQRWARPVVDVVRAPRLHDQDAPGAARRAGRRSSWAGGPPATPSRWSSGTASPPWAASPPRWRSCSATTDFESTDTTSVRMIAMGGGPSTAALVREARAASVSPWWSATRAPRRGWGSGPLPMILPRTPRRAWAGPGPGIELTIRSDDDRPAPGRRARPRLSAARRRSCAATGDDPDATAAVFTPDGAVRTGDLGYVDERGRLHLSGRTKEMYVRGGYNVYPLEVENVLADHPGVAHVAVVPRLDPVMGEIGVAVVVRPVRTPMPHARRPARARPGPPGRLQAARSDPPRRRAAPHRHGEDRPERTRRAGGASADARLPGRYTSAPAMSSSSGSSGSSTAARMASAISLALQHLVAQQPVGHPLLEGLSGHLGVPVVGERRRRVAHRHAQDPQVGLLGPQAPGQLGQGRLGGAVDTEPRPRHRPSSAWSPPRRGASARRRCSRAARTTRAAPTRLVASISCHIAAGASATRTSGELPDMYSTHVDPTHPGRRPRRPAGRSRPRR